MSQDHFERNNLRVEEAIEEFFVFLYKYVYITPLKGKEASVPLPMPLHPR